MKSTKGNLCGLILESLRSWTFLWYNREKIPEIHSVSTWSARSKLSSSALEARIPLDSVFSSSTRTFYFPRSEKMRFVITRMTQRKKIPVVRKDQTKRPPKKERNRERAVMANCPLRIQLVSLSHAPLKLPFSTEISQSKYIYSCTFECCPCYV